MDENDLRTHIARLGLSQVGLAKYLQISDRTVRRYCAGKAKIPATIAELLPRLSKAEVRRTMKEREG